MNTYTAVCKVSCFNFKIPEDFSENIRLDKYLSDQIPEMNRSKLKTGLKELLLNGKTAKLSSKIKSCDVITVTWEDQIPQNIQAENIPLNIIFENDDVTVINKEQGMVTHPAAGNWSGTLVNALLYHWNKGSLSCKPDEIALNNNSFRTGIVHRLDKDTSGIIITAKNRAAEEFLLKQFKRHKLRKEYIAIACGRPKYKGGIIETQIIRDPGNRKRFKAVKDTENGKYAKTIYHCIACYGNYSLLRFRIKTGRTHQIRVHAKYLGCPLLGDPIYGKKDTLFPDATLMLHSRLLRIFLPGQNYLTEFKARVPHRFKTVLKKLHESFPKELITKVEYVKK